MGNRFLPPITGRMRIWGHIIWGEWRKWVIIVYVAVGLYDTIQTQLFPDANIPIIAHLLPQWPWWAWTLIGLVVLLIMILEGTYRKISKLERANKPGEQKTLGLGKEPMQLHPKRHDPRYGTWKE